MVSITSVSGTTSRNTAEELAPIKTETRTLVDIDTANFTGKEASLCPSLLQSGFTSFQLQPTGVTKWGREHLFSPGGVLKLEKSRGEGLSEIVQRRKK